ncbi:hypothetical protein L195_g044510 [Trifolium pratense]|uniref:Uncharacterized protein n=1 Tax=Trifolium pratense TaxID=57577 RepID=A0A2K3MCA8_TRIPR
MILIDHFKAFFRWLAPEEEEEEEEDEPAISHRYDECSFFFSLNSPNSPFPNPLIEIVFAFSSSSEEASHRMNTLKGSVKIITGTEGKGLRCLV